MKIRRSHLLFAACWPWFSAANAQSNQAAPAPGADSSANAAPAQGGLGEIIVTAQRRSERLQNVPIAVTAVQGPQLAAKGIVTVDAVTSAVPGLEYTVVGPTPTPFLRGVGSPISTPNAESSTAIYIDGVYQPFANANIGGFNNVERIEVLKGPQGTLFGRNATAGVLQIITRNPTSTPAAEATVGYDNYHTVFGSVYANAPIAEDLAANLAVSFNNQGKGWGRNITTGAEMYKRNEVSIRSKLRYTPGDATEIVLTGEYRHLALEGFDVAKIANGAPALDGSLPAPGRYDMQGDTNGFTRMRHYDLSLHVTHDFDWFRLVSISAWAMTRHLNQEDIDTSPSAILSFLGPIHQRNMSQEFQLTSPNGSKIDWVAGVYLYQNVAGYSNAVYSGSLGGTSITSYQRTRSAAVYAQATAEVLPSLKFTAGIRYSGDWQRVRGRTLSTLTGSELIPLTIQYQSAKKPTWRLALDYAFSKDIHTYFSYNRGVKSGGFALLSYTDPGYKPETLDAYEVGLKSELFNRHLRFNAAAFYYDFRNLQVEVTPAGMVETLNAANAHIRGAEFELEAIPLPHLTLSAGYTYVHGRYVKFPNAPYNPNSALWPNPYPLGFDAAGRETLQTPTNSANISADYVINSEIGDFTISGSARYYGEMPYNVFNDFVRRPYTNVNLTLNWKSTDGHLGAQLFVRNVLKTYSTAQGVATGLGWLVSPTPPRTIGASFSVKL